MSICVAVVASTDGKCTSPSTTIRSMYPLCTTHANVYDEYAKYVGIDGAHARITTGATYSDQGITPESPAFTNS